MFCCEFDGEWSSKSIGRLKELQQFVSMRAHLAMVEALLVKTVLTVAFPVVMAGATILAAMVLLKKFW
uniref:Uncharacterized protein n=1 Tax=Ditylenchus dipsaci TaxID=166011 RepID=A0A915ESR1_9BILA